MGSWKAFRILLFLLRSYSSDLHMPGLGPKKLLLYWEIPCLPEDLSLPSFLGVFALFSTITAL